MYIPKINEETDQEYVFEFIKNNGFGILISTNDTIPVATHIPITLETDEKNTSILRGHIAKSNPHWQLWEKNTDVLVIFSGTHSYISSSWYEKPTVSTWNYLAVHIYGTIRIVNDSDLLDSLKYLTNKYEQHQENPLFFENLDPVSIQKMLKAIVGFEITINKIEAKAKLSQNRNDTDYKNIIQHLNKSDDAQAHEVAKEMIKRKNI